MPTIQYNPLFVVYRVDQSSYSVFNYVNITLHKLHNTIYFTLFKWFRHLLFIMHSLNVFIYLKHFYKSFRIAVFLYT